MSENAMGTMTDDTPLELGAEVAWVIKSAGKTVGLSAIHRYFENGETFCNHPVPPVDRQLDLRLIRKAMNVCSRCEAMCARALKLQERATA